MVILCAFSVSFAFLRENILTTHSRQIPDKVSFRHQCK